MKILLVHLGVERDDLSASLREFGHHVQVVSTAAAARAPWTGDRPDVILARLEADSAACIEAVEALVSQRPLAAAPVLVTGTNEVGITAARRRFPDASFARIDSVQTTLASMEAGE